MYQSRKDAGDAVAKTRRVNICFMTERDAVRDAVEAMG